MKTSPRMSIAKLMIIVAILAIDLATLCRTLPRIPNPGLVLMVAILEVGLSLAVARYGPARAFWVGFEAFGWAYVLACFAFSRSAWAFARSLFEGYVLGAKISQPSEMWPYILFAGGLQLVLSLAVALIGGLLFHRGANPRSSGMTAENRLPVRPNDESPPNQSRGGRDNVLSRSRSDTRIEVDRGLPGQLVVRVAKRQEGNGKPLIDLLRRSRSTA